MPENANDLNLHAARSAHLRKVGLTVLFGGLALAALIYIFGPDGRSPDENILMSDYYKRQDSDTQRMWGNSGSVVLGITRSFRSGLPYAIILAILSAIICGVCFYLADHPNEKPGE